MEVFAVEVLFVLLLGEIVAPSEAETCSCYKFHSSGSGWNKNRKSCQDTRGDLVSMETDDEWEFVKNLTQHRTTDEWYIGLEKDRGTGKWSWVNGMPLNIKRWQKGRPDNRTYETVAVIAKNYPPGKYGLFNNIRPETNRGYICEVKTENCSYKSCWLHPTSPPTRVSRTSSQETHTTLLSTTLLLKFFMY